MTVKCIWLIKVPFDFSLDEDVPKDIKIVIDKVLIGFHKTPSSVFMDAIRAEMLYDVDEVLIDNKELSDEMLEFITQRTDYVGERINKVYKCILSSSR